MHKTRSGEYVIFEDQPEGNSMYIICIVKNMIRQIWKDEPEEAERRVEDFLEKAFSGNYDNLKKVSKEAVLGLLIFGLSKDYEITAVKRSDSVYHE